MKAIFKVLLFLGLILAGKFYKEEAAQLAEEVPATTPATTIQRTDEMKLVQMGSSDDKDKVEVQLQVKTTY